MRVPKEMWSETKLITSGRKNSFILIRLVLQVFIGRMTDLSRSLYFCLRTDLVIPKDFCIFFQWVFLVAQMIDRNWLIKNVCVLINNWSSKTRKSSGYILSRDSKKNLSRIGIKPCKKSITSKVLWSSFRKMGICHMWSTNKFFLKISRSEMWVYRDKAKLSMVQDMQSLIFCDCWRHK